MAEKRVQINVDVNTNVEESIAGLKALKRQLKETAAGSEDFKRIVGQIDDLEDKLKGSKSAATDWVDSLEAAGGPLGMLAGAINKAKLATVSFGAALKAAGIGLLVSAVAGIAAAFSQSEEQTKKFQPVLIQLQRILNGVLEVLTPLIDAVLEFALKAMPYVSNAVKFAYVNITVLLQSLGKLGEAVVKFVKGDFTGAWEAAKSSVLDFGKRYEEANARFEVGTKKLTNIEKEELAKRSKNNNDAAEERKRIREEELKELLEGQKDAFLSTLSEREQEEYKVREHYANLLYLATKYGDDTTVLKEAQAKALAEIDDKYKKEEAEKQKKADEDKKKQQEEFNKYINDSYQKIKELDAKRVEDTFKTNQAIDQSWVDLGNNISNIIGSVKGVFEEGSNAAKAFAIAQIAINAASSIGQILVNNQAAQFEFNKAIATGNAAILSAIPKLANPFTAPLGIAEAAAGKAAIAGAVAGKAALKVNTALQIATVGVSSAAQIAAVLSAKKAGGGGGGSNAGGGGGNSAGANIPTPQVGATAVPQFQTGTTQSPTQQIGETIASARAPLRAYVVSQDVQSAAALERRTARAATFSGG